MTQTVFPCAGIKSGPSKEDLHLALFHSKKLVNPAQIFSLDNGRNLHVLIDFVEREDGSDESFNIQGRVVGGTHPGGKVKIYFSTLRRHGTMTFIL